MATAEMATAINVGPVSRVDIPVPEGGGVARVCDGCGCSFVAKASEVRRGRGRFCSLSCAGRNNNRVPSIDLTGKTFDRWMVISYAGNKSWLCRCQCGTERSVPGFALRNGRSRSCGCIAVEMLVARGRTHGMRHTPEWEAWCAMRARCLNPQHHAYADYGGRGITVCQEWRDSFEAFYRDMGQRPEGHTLERKNNDGNYEPGNCRWAPRAEQELNKRSNRLLTFQGVTLPLSAMARRHGLTPGALRDRLDYGWSLERALTTPVRKRRTSNVSC